MPSSGDTSYSPTISPEPEGIVTAGAGEMSRHTLAIHVTIYPDLGQRGERQNGRGAGFARVRDDAADVNEGLRGHEESVSGEDERRP